MTTYATEIRDLAATILTSAAPAPYALIRKHWGWPLGEKDLPALSVFVPREMMTPDGDSNAGEPSFIHDVTLGVIISTGFATPDALEADTGSRADAALAALLTSPTFLREFESVDRVEQGTVFREEGSTFIVEASFNITIRFRSDWPPVVPDNFESMKITAAPAGSDQYTPTASVVLDIPQE